MINHHEKIMEEVKHLAAEYISRESNRVSLVTVTNIMVSEDTKRATLYISVLPEDKENDALFFLKRKRTEMRDFIKERIRSRVIPFLDIEIDVGEKHRERIEQLIRESHKDDIKKSTESYLVLFRMVPRVGVEPTRHCCLGILSPLCLPFHHPGKMTTYCNLEVQAGVEPAHIGFADRRVNQLRHCTMRTQPL